MFSQVVISTIATRVSIKDNKLAGRIRPWQDMKPARGK